MFSFLYLPDIYPLDIPTTPLKPGDNNNSVECSSTDVFEKRMATGRLMFLFLARFHPHPVGWKAFVLAFTT